MAPRKTDRLFDEVGIPILKCQEADDEQFAFLGIGAPLFDRKRPRIAACYTKCIEIAFEPCVNPSHNITGGRIGRSQAVTLRPLKSSQRRMLTQDIRNYSDAY